MAGALAGCATLRPPPAMPGDPDAAWAEVLRERVDERGRVDFAGLARQPAALDTYVAHVGMTAPEGIADRAARIAYLINAYNALAMWNVLQAGIPERLSLLGRVGFFKATRLVVGGRPISLYDFENDVIRPLGEERVHFALNCMVVSCPRLPRVPFTGPGLERELEGAARLFFSEPRNLRVDEEAGVMRVSAILDFYTRDFLAKAPDLPAYVSRYTAAPVPPGARTEFLDYDWTINRQPARGAA
jgi:hypothetical protein